MAHARSLPGPVAFVASGMPGSYTRFRLSPKATVKVAEMPGVILAVVERPEIAAHTLAAAETLADLTGAGLINVLVMRTPAVTTILVTDEVLTRQDQTRRQTEERGRAAALGEVFEAWAPSVRARGIRTNWCDVEEFADTAVAEWGRRADFIVVPRPWRHSGEPERQAIHAALFDSDRPVLVIPPDKPPENFGRRVVIAWRDDPRTIRAVLAALRLITAAERVHVLAGVREGAPRLRLPEILTEHGIDADLHVLPLAGHRTFGEALLEKAHALGADLLVQGAYAYRPIVGLLLGGVTRHMLTHADLPVLMRH
jgi:nucleotide-binding universal stress UspA family protein